MAATTGYQIGPEANQTLLSYGVETVWGTKPAVQFQAIRYTSESMARSKQRQRPAEINPSREVSAAITTQDSAGGAINFAFSYQTYDDFISVLLGNDWGSLVSPPDSIAVDTTLTNTSATTATLVSTLAGKYTNVIIGQWIRIFGATNAANNAFYRVSAKPNAQSLTLTTLAATVTETSAAGNIKVRASSIQNGTQFKSLWLQQKLSSALFLNYPGSYVGAMTLSGAVGQFMNGSFTLTSQTETTTTSEGSTGAVLAAPTGKVMDTVSGFTGIYLNEVAFGATVDNFSLTMTNQSATPEFGIGSASAQGMLAGTFMLSGSMKIFFKDFTNYTRFQNETGGTLEFIMKDSAGNGYIITVLNAVFSGGTIESGSVGTAVMSTFQIEGNPVSGGTGTVQIDRLAAT